MAIPHAQPGEVIDVRPLGPTLAGAMTTALVKTESLEVIRLVIPRGKEIPTHKTRGEITVQCMEGQVAFTTGGVTHELVAGQLLYLHGEQPHSILGIDDASLLITITFPRYSPFAERLAHSGRVGPLKGRAVEGIAMSPDDAGDALSPDVRVTSASVPGISVAVPPVHAYSDASRHGGRIDFDTATDLVDQASQESFPASDSPAWTFLDTHRLEHQRDWTMSKKSLIHRENEQHLPASEASQAREGQGEIGPSETGRERVAALAYELWESHGRPEGTDLEDWLWAERRLQCHT